MPILTSTDRTFKVVLDIDKDIPAEKQPRFIGRVLSKGQWRAAAEKFDAVMANESGIEVLNKLDEILTLTLLGWENMIDPANGQPLEFSSGNINNFLTQPEAVELVEKILAQGVSSADKKKLDSPSACATEKSAPDAPDS